MCKIHLNVLRAQLKVAKIANFYKVSPNPGRGCPLGVEGCRVRVATVVLANASQSVTIRTHACCIGNETTVWSCFDVHMDQENEGISIIDQTW